MVDSVQVFPPGFRATDNNGNLITDGVLSFFDTGTTNPKTVYSDVNLSVSLGSTVNCNSAGYPVTSGNAKTLVYTDADLYKVRLTSVAFGGTVFEHDAVRGAVDTSNFLTSAVAADKTIVPVSVNRAVTVSDKGKLLNVNVTSGTLTITVDPASTLGSGFWCGVAHNGTANQVKIIGNGTDTFVYGGVATTAFSLTGKGHTVWIACDGTGFVVDGDLPAFLGLNNKIMTIVSTLSTPPGSPTPGARYLVGVAPTGAWSTFSVGDIVEANGSGGWIRYTPPTNCGWVIYLQSDNNLYVFRSTAWAFVTPAASTTVSGITRFATAAEMETAGSFGSIAVVPSTMHHHPGMCKAWAYVTYTAGVPTVMASNNIASIVDGGAGTLGINLVAAFSSANWSDMGHPFAGVPLSTTITAKGAGAETLIISTMGGVLTDPAAVSFAAFGDQ